VVGESTGQNTSNPVLGGLDALVREREMQASVGASPSPHGPGRRSTGGRRSFGTPVPPRQVSTFGRVVGPALAVSAVQKSRQKPPGSARARPLLARHFSALSDALPLLGWHEGSHLAATTSPSRRSSAEYHAARLPEGSTAGFEEFFVTQHDRLCRALMHLTRNSDEAEDIAQETFTKILER
jgi:hypothetical protein